MSNFYKVTSINQKYTKKNDKVYDIVLNNIYCIKNVNPDKVWLSSGLKNKGFINEIYQFWVKNNYSLDLLKGKYISLKFKQTNYGLQISYIISLDIISDFKKMLDDSDGKGFSTELPIYKLLEHAKYKKNNDNSINLKDSFSKYRIKEELDYTICYPHSKSNEFLTIDNINYIYEKFYSELKRETLDGNLDFKHMLSDDRMSIIKRTWYVKVSYKMTTSGDYCYTKDKIILRIGDKLDDNIILALKNQNNDH